MNDAIGDSIREYTKKIEQKEISDKLHKEFADFDCRNLPKMKDKDLAAWQSKHPMDSPQYIIALQEWNRRATVKQINAIKFAAYIGFIGIIIGSLLTYILTNGLPWKAQTPIATTSITSENKAHNVTNAPSKHSKQRTKDMEAQPSIPINNVVDPASKTIEDKHIEIAPIPYRNRDAHH